jgi:hypothetical protein
VLTNAKECGFVRSRRGGWLNVTACQYGHRNTAITSGKSGRLFGAEVRARLRLDIAPREHDHWRLQLATRHEGSGIIAESRPLQRLSVAARHDNGRCRGSHCEMWGIEGALLFLPKGAAKAAMGNRAAATIVKTVLFMIWFLAKEHHVEAAGVTVK